MKKFASLIFISLVSFLSFSQKNINLFVTDFYNFTMSVDEFYYFMNTDTTFNKWSIVESYDSDFFMLFDINFENNNLVSSIDQGDTLNVYPISKSVPQNSKSLNFVITDSNNSSHNVSLYQVNGSYKFVKYHFEGNYVIGYIAKKVSLL